MAGVPVKNLLTASNGEQGLEVLKSNWIDMVFADTLRRAKGRIILGCFMHLSDSPVDEVPDVDPYYRGHIFPRGGPGTSPDRRRFQNSDRPRTGGFQQARHRQQFRQSRRRNR